MGGQVKWVRWRSGERDHANTDVTRRSYETDVSPCETKLKSSKVQPMSVSKQTQITRNRSQLSQAWVARCVVNTYTRVRSKAKNKKQETVM